MVDGDAQPEPPSPAHVRRDGAEPSDVELVRPYVAALVPPPAKHRDGGRTLAARRRSVDAATVSFPKAAAADGDADRHPISTTSRTRRLVVVSMGVGLLVVIVGGYVIVKPHPDPPRLPSAASLAAPPLIPTTVPASVPAPDPAASGRPRTAGHSPAAVSVTSRSQRPSARPSPAASDTPQSRPTAPPTESTLDLAAGRPVTDTGHADIYVAANAVDNDPSTYWESTDSAFPQSITVDLGSETAIGRIVLTVPPVAAWNTRTQTLSVSGSVDGTAFAGIVGSAGYTFDPATGNIVRLTFATTTTRYVRLTFTANTVWPAGQLSGLEIYPPSS
jgi:hypothetical protein